MTDTSAETRPRLPPSRKSSRMPRLPARFTRSAPRPGSASGQPRLAPRLRSSAALRAPTMVAIRSPCSEGSPLPSTSGLRFALFRPVGGALSPQRRRVPNSDCGASRRSVRHQGMHWRIRSASSFGWSSRTVWRGSQGMRTGRPNSPVFLEPRTGLGRAAVANDASLILH
jgi:hypothetical protein